MVDTEYITDDSSTDVLKLQMYDEIVQRFGPDEQFSEMLRSKGTLDRMKSKNSNDLTISSTPTTSSSPEREDQVEDITQPNNGKVEVLLITIISERNMIKTNNVLC